MGSAGSSPHSSISSMSSGSGSEVVPPFNFNKPLEQQQQPFNFNKPETCSLEEGPEVVKDLKWSLSSYFGANHRIARGEKFQVIAKRLPSNGDVQHLMAWDQPITRPFLITTSTTTSTIDIDHDIDTTTNNHVDADS